MLPAQKTQKGEKMKHELTTSEAASILANDENANFSRAGAFALVEYLEEMEESCGESIEFDKVAIRCDYSEYADLQEWAGGCFGTVGGVDQAPAGIGYDADDDDETKNDAIREYICDNGQLIEFDGGFIVNSF